MSMQDCERTIAKAKNLTAEQKKRLGWAANDVWDNIGGDCLRAMEECGEKPIVKRSVVIELVVDADRLADELRRTQSTAETENADLLEFVQFAKYEEIVKALKPAFPFATYGW